MKLKHNIYKCEWCKELIEYKPKKSFAQEKPDGSFGRHTVTSTLKCPYCGNNVSQK